jgi:hypothetical protein
VRPPFRRADAGKSRLRPAFEDRETETLRGAAAGVFSAAVWAAIEPILGRLISTPYSDVRLLGRAVTRSRLWPLAGLALHLTNGAVFGVLFCRAGLKGVKAGVAAAEIENLLLWPGFALVDRIHPDRRAGHWPPLLRNRRVAGYEVLVHAVFGATLGALTRTSRRRFGYKPDALTPV